MFLAAAGTCAVTALHPRSKQKDGAGTMTGAETAGGSAAAVTAGGG